MCVSLDMPVFEEERQQGRVSEGEARSDVLKPKNHVQSNNMFIIIIVIVNE